MRRWLLVSLSVVASLAFLGYVVGTQLPLRHRAAMEGVVAAPVPDLAARVRQVRGYPSWRSGVTVTNVVESEAATTYIEVTGDGRIAYRLTEPVRDRQFVTAITDPTLPFGGHWTITLTGRDGGTHVRIEEAGEIRSPIYRLFSRFVFGYTTNIQQYLRDLGAAGIAAS
jgi:hypothetical protein